MVAIRTLTGPAGAAGADGADGATGATGSQGLTGAAGTGSASIVEAQLSTNVAVAATTLPIDRNATGPFRAQNWVVIDSGTSQCEVKKINSVSTTNIVLVSGLKYAHNTGDVVLAVEGLGMLTPSMWGCVGTSSADDTDAMQEAVDQAGKTEVFHPLDGQQKSYGISAPIVLPFSMQLKRMRLFAKAGMPATANTFMLMSMQASGPIDFTADASTDIVTATAHGLTADGQLVMLKASSMPGGLVKGQIYYAFTRTTNTFKLRQGTLTAEAVVANDATVTVKDTSLFPSSGNLHISATTFTYTGKTATTFTGCVGSPTAAAGVLVSSDDIDITSAGGGGKCYAQINALEKVTLEQVTADTQSLAGVNACSFNLQQPSSTKDLRVDGLMSGCVGLRLRGQYSAHFNMEINAAANNNGAICLDLAGSGHGFDGIIFGHGSDHVQIDRGQGATCCSFKNLWTERCDYMVHIKGQAIALDIRGWLQSFGTGTDVALKIDALSNSASQFSISGARGNNGANTMVSDDLRGFTILDNEFPGGAITHYVQPSGLVAPLMARVPVTTAVDRTLKISDEVVFVTAACTITLPSAVGISGKMYVVKSKTASTITLATTSSQTIDGAAPGTITVLYDKVAVVSDGSNWMSTL